MKINRIVYKELANEIGKQLSLPYFQIVRRCQKAEVFPGNCAVIPATNFLMLTE